MAIEINNIVIDKAWLIMLATLSSKQITFTVRSEMKNGALYQYVDFECDCDKCKATGGKKTVVFINGAIITPHPHSLNQPLITYTS